MDTMLTYNTNSKTGPVCGGRALKQHLNIRISSPYEQWMSSQGKQLEPSKELLTLRNGVSPSIQNAEIIEPPEDVKADIDVMDKKLIKKKKWLQRRRELHSWFKRAEAVGITPMPARRPTKGQRLAWEESIIQAEGL